MQDLFLTNDQKSIAKRSFAVIKTVFQLGNATTLPSFRLGIDMDLSHAMIWCQDAFKLPTIIALACWFITGPVDDERSRVWLYNMHRYACQTDCERTIRQYVDKVKLVIKAFQQRIGTAEGQGVLECFADSEFLKRVDIFKRRSHQHVGQFAGIYVRHELIPENIYPFEELIFSYIFSWNLSVLYFWP